MPVISFVSSKGGVGKTTSAVVLAGEFVAVGRKVVLIDADPNRPLELWSRIRPLPDRLRIVIDDSAETIMDTIDETRAGADFVIVDLEGTATDRIGYAVAQSDLVLIPLQRSLLDANEAAKSIKHVRQMSRVANRDIPYRAFFTRVPPAIRERTGQNIEQQFTDGAVPTLPVSLIDRAAYRALFSFGGTLHELESADVSGLDSARENAREFAQAVINTLRGGAA